MKVSCLLCIICCCGSPLAAQDHSWIGLPATSFDISAVAVRDTIIIPLIPGPGLEAGDLPLVRQAVDWIRLNQLDDITFYDGFLFSIDNKGRLLVDINMDIIKDPGRYEARIALSASGKDSKEFTLRFNLPAAKLEALQPVTIHIAGDKVVAQDSLTLRETGRRSSIFGLGLPAPRFTGVKDVDLVRFPAETYTVQAGGVLKAAYTVDDRVRALPLGTTIGRMVINSRSLIAPVTVNFRIIHTRPTYWIFICLALGLLFGSVVRLFIMNKSDLTDAITQALFLGVVLSLAAYIFYAPSFVGTANELIGIFFFAFVMDLASNRKHPFHPLSIRRKAKKIVGDKKKSIVLPSKSI